MISSDVWVLLIMVACGGGISLFFDILRALRMELRPNAVIVAISDVLFCALAALAAAACVWNFNGGAVRYYQAAGLILGGILYFMLLSRWILKFFRFIIRNILRFVRFIFKLLLTPRRFLYKILVVPIFGYAGKLFKRSHSSHGKQLQRKGDKLCKKT